MREEPIKSRRILGHQGELVAIFISSTDSTEGIEFFTPSDNNLQVGLMRRSADTPVKAHIHNPVKRSIEGTQEFLLVRKGSMRVKLFSRDLLNIETLELSEGDSILLISGGHEIIFDSECDLLEVKQGPYSSEIDKIQIEKWE